MCRVGLLKRVFVWIRQKLFGKYLPGEYRNVRKGEIFKAGRRFRMNISTGKSQVRVEKNDFK